MWEGRAATPETLDSTYEILREKEGMAWIRLREFALHHLAVKDAITAHQRAKLERYDTI